MRAFDFLAGRTVPHGLYPIRINPNTGKFTSSQASDPSKKRVNISPDACKLFTLIRYVKVKSMIDADRIGMYHFEKQQYMYPAAFNPIAGFHIRTYISLFTPSPCVTRLFLRAILAFSGYLWGLGRLVLRVPVEGVDAGRPSRRELPQDVRRCHGRCSGAPRPEGATVRTSPINLGMPPCLADNQDPLVRDSCRLQLNCHPHHKKKLQHKLLFSVNLSYLDSNRSSFSPQCRRR